MLLQMTLFCSFYGSVILHCIYVSHLLYQFLYWWSFRLLKCCSIFWLLWIMLQCTSGCMYLFGLWFSLDKCPGVRLLDHMIALFLVFWGASIPFSIVAVPVYIPTNNVGGFPFLYTLSIVYCLAMVVLTGVRWNLMVVFIYNFLIISDVKHLFMWCLNLYVFFGEMCI